MLCIKNTKQPWKIIIFAGFCPVACLIKKSVVFLYVFLNDRVDALNMYTSMFLTLQGLCTGLLQQIHICLFDVVMLQLHHSVYWYLLHNYPHPPPLHCLHHLCDYESCVHTLPLVRALELLRPCCVLRFSTTKEESILCYTINSINEKNIAIHSAGGSRYRFTGAYRDKRYNRDIVTPLIHTYIHTKRQEMRGGERERQTDR